MDQSKRGRFQYTVPTLCIVVFVFSLICSAIAGRMEQVRRQKRVAARIDLAGGYAIWTGWGNIHRVRLSDAHIANGDLACLAQLPYLRELDLADTRVTDRDLQHLEGLRKLAWIPTDRESHKDCFAQRSDFPGIRPKCYSRMSNSNDILPPRYMKQGRIGGSSANTQKWRISRGMPHVSWMDA